MIDEFITYKGFIYKKIGQLGSILKQCPNCNAQFFTKEQRKNIAAMLVKLNIGEKIILK